MSLPFTESFTGIADGELPPGWLRDIANWGVWGSQAAGGEPPEMRFNYTPLVTGEFRVSSPRIDTSGREDLHLLFKTSVDNFGDPGPYTLSVLASAGGEDRPVYEWAAPGDIPASQFRTVLTEADHGVGSEDFRIIWAFSGKSININYWYFDDVYLAATTPTVTPTPEGFRTPSPTPTVSPTPEGFKSPSPTPEGYRTPTPTPTVTPTPTLPPLDLPYTENFAGIADGKLPPGWLRDIANWGVWGSQAAGGEPPEMRFNYTPLVTGEFRVSSPRIDTSGREDLHLLFKTSVDNFGDPGPYTLSVLASAGGEDRPVYEWAAPGDIPASQFRTVLTEADHGVGSEDFRIIWAFSGKSININYWYFDDVYLAATTPTVTPTPEGFRTPSPTPTPTPVPSPSLTPPPAPRWIYDYSGDGTSDIAIFRPSSGLWAVRGLTRAYFGAEDDIPVPGDYSGDGTTDIAIFRDSNGLWAVRDLTRVYFGRSGDLPFSGDYGGSVTCGPGIFRPSSGLWAIRGFTRAYFGRAGDIPVPGYYSGSAGRDIGVFRPDTGLWAIRGVTRVYFGRSGDLPVPGDYSWEGRWTPAVFRPAVGLWAIRDWTRVYFGGADDYPCPGVYAGDGADRIGIFRESTGLWAVRDWTRVYFGRPEDLPVTR